MFFGERTLHVPITCELWNTPVVQIERLEILHRVTKKLGLVTG